MTCSPEVWNTPGTCINQVLIHKGMRVEVMVDGQMTPKIEVRNGLRQGCTIALTLFNYGDQVLERALPLASGYYSVQVCG